MNGQGDDPRPNPPAPERRPGRWALPFSILSAGISVLFILYGVRVLAAGGSAGALGFGAATVAYGALALLALGCAYKYRTVGCVRLSQVVGSVYLLLYVLALAARVGTGLGVGGVLVVALALWGNWFAVNQVVRRR